MLSQEGDVDVESGGDAHSEPVAEEVPQQIEKPKVGVYNELPVPDHNAKFLHLEACGLAITTLFLV